MLLNLPKKYIKIVECFAGEDEVETYIPCKTDMEVQHLSAVATTAAVRAQDELAKIRAIHEPIAEIKNKLEIMGN